MEIDKTELCFKLFKKSESEKLAHWIASENWPFHGAKNPSLKKVRKWISDGSYTGKDNKTFWVFLNDRPEPIAIACLQELTDITPIFDLRINSSVRNRGIGRKILNWMAQYVFTKTKKHRLEGHTRIDNIAMQRVFKACGWVKEAYYRKAWPGLSGNYHDAVTYALLKCDWETGVKTKIDWSEEV